MSRPTFDSLKIRPHVGRDMILFKEAQAGMPGGGMQPEVGQSPVTGNSDEMQAPESANQRQFEDDFGSLAYQFVQDRAPALIPYMLGFEVVDRNEDGSKAVGIFGYKVDDDFYYVPAFFLNNQVRGVDLILNKKTNQFVPLTEKWIDYIVNKHAIRIGTPASSEVRDTMRNPDLSFVQRPQVAIGKMASEQKAEPWTSQEAWAHIKEATANMVSDPGFQEMLSGVLAKGEVEKAAESPYVRTFMEKVGGPECMTRFLKTLHDVGFANAALSLYKDAEAFWVGKEKLVGAAIHVDRLKKLAAARPKVRVIDTTEGLAKVAQDTPETDIGEEDKPMTVEENARQIVEHDFTIEDTRPEDETAQVTDDEALVDFEHRFNPPDGPGEYSFMMSDGLSRKGTMLNAVISPYCGKKNTLILFEDDGYILTEASPRAIITTDESEDEDNGQSGQGGIKDVFKELFGKAKAFSEIEIGLPDKKSAQDAGSPAQIPDSSYYNGRPYLFIDDKGNAAGPFFIKFVLADGDHIRFATGYSSPSEVIFSTHTPDGLSESYGFMDWDLKDRYHDSDGNRDSKCDCCKCEDCSPNIMLSIGSFSGLPKKTGEGILIPHDWKALPIRMFPSWLPYDDNLTQAERDKRDAEANKLRTEKKEKYTFGNTMDILEEMKSEGISRIKIACDGTDYAIVMDGAKRRHGPFGYKAAAVELVTRFGFRPRRAFATLSKAASSGSTILLVQIPSLVQTVKKAQDGLVNVSMPAPQEQLPSIDPYSGVPVYQSPYIDVTRGQFTGVPGLPPEGGMTRGINMGGEMERNMGAGEYPDEHTDSLGDGALPIDEEARRLAEEAAKAGQRHVFDQAAIGGLVKVFDTANVVDSYIPDFMDTIDRLGRILFLFYWKHEDFNQRYGSDDVVQMEDRLRNVFKQMGELTLNLKEKSVQKE